MSKKSSRKGKLTQTRQQQQQAAARRRDLSTGTGVTRVPTHRDPQTRGTGASPRESTDAARRPGQVRHYLDVSAVRIQEWLARTPDLKFRRGASIMLSAATGRDAWPDARLPAGVGWNTEAGDLDGVVSLTVTTAVPGDEVIGCLAAAAREVAAGLRRDLPFCHIQAVAGAGDSYATAYGEIDRARRDGDFLVDAPPAPAEMILAKPCDQCRAAPAEHAGVEIVGAEHTEDLCGECLKRVKAAGGTKGDWERRSPRPERRMKEAVGQAGIPEARFYDDFAQLAEAGRRAQDDAATQLALIYADGNRVSAFLAEAAAYARDHGRPPKAEIVRALDGATLAALAEAIVTCFQDHERLPVLAHLAGGDDLMVSVPAPFAWPFVRALLPAFRDKMKSAAEWPEPVRRRLPSLSAGLAFHHHSAPFPDVVRLAKDQLDLAKRATRGEEPSVAFLDLTADGGHAPAGRQPLTLDQLTDRAATLDQIARIPRSHLQTLVGLHRLSLEAEEEVSSRAETPVEALARRIADLGYRPLWEVVAGPGADAETVRSAVVTSEMTRNELRRVLDLARWWSPGGTQEPTLPVAGRRVGEEALV